MRKIGLLVLALCAFATNVKAGSWEGDYLKITGEWTRLNSDWCGGDARVACDGYNCEVRIQNSRCEVAEVYLEQRGNVFRNTDRSYTTKLVSTGFNRYSGNIYIDLRRAQTADHGFAWDWKNYWVNIVVRDDSGRKYEKICPNFRARDIRY